MYINNSSPQRFDGAAEESCLRNQEVHSWIPDHNMPHGNFIKSHNPV